MLTREDLAALYAGYDLHSEAQGGDIPPHTAENVISFLHQTFAPWWERFTTRIQNGDDSVQPPRPDEQTLSARVREIVERKKFLSVDEVVATLEVKITTDEVLALCRFHTSIRVYPHPNMTLLQWQNL